jgi:hypothetical protein
LVPMDRNFFYKYFMHFSRESDLNDAYILIAREITMIYSQNEQEMGRLLLLMDETYEEFMQKNFRPVH